MQKDMQRGLLKWQVVCVSNAIRRMSNAGQRVGFGTSLSLRCKLSLANRFAPEPTSVGFNFCFAKNRL